MSNSDWITIKYFLLDNEENLLANGEINYAGRVKLSEDGNHSFHFVKVV